MTMRHWKWQKTEDRNRLASWIDQVNSLSISDLPPEQRLAQALYSVAIHIKADHGILFYKDLIRNKIAIVESVNDISPPNNISQGLAFSPVNDVFETGHFIIDDDVYRHVGKYAELLVLFDFHSCMAFPIYVFGECTHVVFFFCDRKKAFSHSDHLYAVASTLPFGTLLENIEINKRLKAINPIIIQGELTGRLSHEIRGLQHRLLNQVEMLLLRFPDMYELKDLLDSVRNAIQTVNTIESLRHSSREEYIDIPSTITQIVQLMRFDAKNSGVTIEVAHLDSAPNIYINKIGFQQIILNIILNAQQHISLQPKTSLKTSGLIEVTGSYIDSAYVIRISDNGPGIHRTMWERIFRPGISGRGGSGLGLSIARSFMATSGGSIKVEESVMMVGTTFLIELPITKS